MTDKIIDTIIDATEFNAKNIKYKNNGVPKANASQGKSLNIMYGDNGIRLSTPLMLTWGASDFVDPQTGKGNGKYEMALQFSSADYKNEDSDKFLKNMIDFESKIKADALVHSEKWFGKAKSSEVINELFSPMLKYSSKDSTKAPTLRVKIPIWENVWKVEIYDENGEKQFPCVSNPSLSPLEFLEKGTNVALLMQCGGLWFANGKFGVTWKLIQAVVQKRASLTGQCFIKLKPSEKEKIKAVLPASDNDHEEEARVDVDDSDDEAEKEPEVKPQAEVRPQTQAEVEPEVVVEEPKVVKKKVVKKKTDA